MQYLTKRVVKNIARGVGVAAAMFAELEEHALPVEAAGAAVRARADDRLAALTGQDT